MTLRVEMGTGYTHNLHNAFFDCLCQEGADRQQDKGNSRVGYRRRNRHGGRLPTFSPPGSVNSYPSGELPHFFDVA